jgi:hypothetical protein
VLSLADTQAHLRHALVTGDASGILPLLVGGRDAGARLAIHRRHYDASLVKALLGKFPATVWLVGGPCVTEAARAFAHTHPPCAPCMAEYGSEFPKFLSTWAAGEGVWPAAERVPYLQAFAQLEWHLGQVAVAIDRAPVPIEQFAQLDSNALMRARLILQPGLGYLAASWPVDELMTLHLTDTAPEQFPLAPADVWIEIRGARGEFQINRVDAGDFIFRTAILEGLSIGEAAVYALDAHPGFAPGQALAALVGAGLVTALAHYVRDDER